MHAASCWATERFLCFIFGGDKSTLPRCRQMQESCPGANDREEACRHVVVLDGAPTATADKLVPEVGLQHSLFTWFDTSMSQVRYLCCGSWRGL